MRISVSKNEQLGDSRSCQISAVLSGTALKLAAFAIVSCLPLIVGCESDKPVAGTAKTKRSISRERNSARSSLNDEIDVLTGEPMRNAVFDTYVQVFEIIEQSLSPSFDDVTTDYSVEKIGREQGGRVILHQGVVEGVSESGTLKRLNYDIRFLRSLSEGAVASKCYYANVAGDILIDDRQDAEVVSILGNGEAKQDADSPSP